jgi:hypothetical protein
MDKGDTLHIEASMKMIEAAKLYFASPCQCLGITLDYVQLLPMALFKIPDRNMIGNRWISTFLKEEKERSYVYHVNLASLEVRRRRDATGAGPSIS